ncbi:MAG: TIGR00288 family NYN domain-containing protein [Candidatus Micrarchaeia archaeon]|jgi:uncharacterized protein (TIGR00288 family)
MTVFDKIGDLLKKKKDRNIALFIDGPNVIRKDMHLDLEAIKKELKKHGKLKIGIVFLDQYASDKLIEAMINQGYQPVITSGDVDVTMACAAVEQIFNPHIDTIALMTRDTDFRPVLVKAKEHGKETIVIGGEPGFSIALKNTADVIIKMDNL